MHNGLGSFLHELICKLHLDGLPVREIGIRYDLKKSTINEVLKRFNMRPKRSPQPCHLTYEIYSENGRTMCKRTKRETNKYIREFKMNHNQITKVLNASLNSPPNII